MSLDWSTHCISNYKRLRDSLSLRKFRVLKTALPIILLCCSVVTIAGNLEIKFPDNLKKDVISGANFNIMVKISNQGNTDSDFQLRINNSDGNFKFIADYSSIPIEKNSSISKIVGIQISNTINAGNFSIELEALDNRDSQSFGKVAIPINVSPKYEININKIKAPVSLFSGDTASVYYLIQNLSNIDVSVKTTNIHGQETKVRILKIPKDSSIISQFLISIPSTVAGYSQQTAILIASIVNKPETEKSECFSFDVFPLKNVKFDRFNRFPVKMGVMAVSSNRLGKQMYSNMYDIQGLGTFGEKNNRTLDFHLRGPDRRGDPLFGLNEEYSLKYTTPHLELAMGDHSFGLSSLTESSRSGRGVKLDYELSKWTVGAYYNIPRYYPLIKQVYASYASFAFNEKNNLSAGFLSKSDTTGTKTMLFTISAKNNFFSSLKTDMEVAVGQNQNELKKAYQASLYFNRSIFSSSLSYLFAEPNFPGYMTNSTRMNSGASLKLKKFTISLNYDQNSTNMALDTLYSNMPHSQNMSLSTSYRFTPKSSISLGGFKSAMKDQSPTPLFDYIRTNGRLTIQSRMRKMNLTLQGDFGKMVNFLGENAGKDFLMRNGSLFVNYATSKGFSASVFTTYQGGQQNISGSELFYYGGTLSTQLFKGISASLQYNSNFEWQYYTSDRSLINLDIHGQINANNEIGLTANYNLTKNSLNNKEYNIKLRYTYTLNIPVSKKKSVGSMTGKIINHGVEKVGGVRLNLDGVIAVSDKEGNFRFPSVPVGTYALRIDGSSFGINAVTELPGPFMINIEPAKVTKYEFAITKSARIEGRLVIQEDERVNQKGFIPVKEEIDKLIIEVSNETEMFRIFTDRDGIFRFEDLRPGNWKLKVYPNGLPSGYQLVTSQFNLNLISGKPEKLDIIIQKKARQIQFQKTIKK